MDRRSLAFFVGLGRALLVLVISVLAGLSVTTANAQIPVALDMRIAGDREVTRIVIEFDRPVEVDQRLLDHPWRLVLDLQKILYGFPGDAADGSSLISGVRYGDMSEQHSRIIFQMTGPFHVRSVRMRQDRESARHNLVIDLEAASELEFAEAVDRAFTTSAVVNSAQKRDRLGTAVQPSRPFTVVLDPGHGGIDGGARGAGGTREKDVTLAFARALRERLSEYAGAQVFMTRDTDVFVSLGDRTGFARQHGADLFISIHADYLRRRDVRGATVYTISEKASDAVAAQIAENENLADSVAGIVPDEESNGVADILIDLARRETLGFSVQFARLAIADMKGFARLIKNPHRFAGFRVLKAPDVPSVLLELGYLSNAEDEKLMKDEEWKQGLADRLALAIEKFAALSSKDIAVASDGN
ncbi:N-acetylmuramoyl-L-alanine amidase [Oricola sp.]|uniref:N-acetylmuramoyl-L-alanine amidase n=1 Tax=Oricola sp. TaxID=1979950 RepID=UPI003BABF48E